MGVAGCPGAPERVPFFRHIFLGRSFGLPAARAPLTHMHLPAPDMEDSLEAGSFYLYSPQARRLGFLSLRGSGEGEGRVKALLRWGAAAWGLQPG